MKNYIIIPACNTEIICIYLGNISNTILTEYDFESVRDFVCEQNLSIEEIEKLICVSKVEFITKIINKEEYVLQVFINGGKFSNYDINFWNKLISEIDDNIIENYKLFLWHGYEVRRIKKSMISFL